MEERFTFIDGCLYDILGRELSLFSHSNPSTVIQYHDYLVFGVDYRLLVVISFDWQRIAVFTTHYEEIIYDGEYVLILTPSDYVYDFNKYVFRFTLPDATKFVSTQHWLRNNELLEGNDVLKYIYDNVVIDNIVIVNNNIIIGTSPWETIINVSKQEKIEGGFIVYPEQLVVSHDYMFKYKDCIIAVEEEDHGDNLYLIQNMKIVDNCLDVKCRNLVLGDMLLEKKDKWYVYEVRNKIPKLTIAYTDIDIIITD